MQTTPQALTITIGETAVRVRMAQLDIHTVEELAQRSTTSALTIRRWFTGQSFTSHNLAKLASALELYTSDAVARILIVSHVT